MPPTSWISGCHLGWCHFRPQSHKSSIAQFESIHYVVTGWWWSVFSTSEFGEELSVFNCIMQQPQPNMAILCLHYDDVIMSAIASQITSLTIVYLTVYSGADQRKHQSSTSLTFVWGLHQDRWIPRTKGQLRGKCFHLMTSSRTSAPLN